MSSAAIRQARAVLELVHDPRVHAIKFARPSSAEAAAELERRCEAVVRHAWALVVEAYGLNPDEGAWAVHPRDDALNCLALAPTRRDAEDIRAWWPGGNAAALDITRVPPPDSSNASDSHARCLAMGVALHWTPPAWLAVVAPGLTADAGGPARTRRAVSAAGPSRA